jgi:hypothetical protein
VWTRKPLFTLSDALCVGTSLWSAEDVRKQIARVRELTDRPFAVNYMIVARWCIPKEHQKGTAFEKIARKRLGGVALQRGADRECYLLQGCCSSSYKA